MAVSLENILCIDDDEDILEVAKFALETIGHFRLDICRGGKEALQRAPLLHSDLILLDIMMPGMDGVSVYKALRQVSGLARVPIVFMTAKVQPTEVIDYLDMGVEGIIPKPFDPLALPAEIESFWNGYRKKESGAA